MRRRITRAIAITALAVAGTVLPATAASAGQTYGPYSSEGTCNYYMYGVRAGGTRTTPCYDLCAYPGSSSCTWSDGREMWVFYAY